jgi:hypothetical protein
MAGVGPPVPGAGPVERFAVLAVTFAEAPAEGKAKRLL